MAGELNEKRQRAIAEGFVRCLPEPKLRLLDAATQSDKPDAAVEVIATGERIGVEVSELLQPNDGEDRHLETLFCTELVEACRELFGPSGDVEVRFMQRPRSERQIAEWLRVFRQKAKLGADRKLRFPPLPTPRRTVEEYRAWQRDFAGLEWAEVDILCDDADSWIVFGAGIDHLANRHAADIDDLVVRAVEKKIRQAAGYSYRGPLWLVLRNACLTAPSPSIDAQLGQLRGVERFAMIWLLPIPEGVIELVRTPTPRCLLRCEQAS